MKKAHLFATAAAILFASSAYAQTGTRETFRPTNACQGCVIDDVSTRPVSQKNPNDFNQQTTIDNCSVVIQGGSGKDLGSNNVAIVDQLGKGNRAGLYQREGDKNYGLQTQDGDNNRAKALVWGSNNTTLQLQKGNGNKAGINVDQVDGKYDPGSTQNGNNNWAQQKQGGKSGGAGDENLADIKTYGNDNIASQDQQGNKNSGSIFQRVNKSVASQLQVGDDNTAVTTQGGMANVASTVQYQRSCIEQGGNGNQALVMQNNK